MDAVCHFNVHTSIDEIRSKSPILKEMERLNEVMIVGAIYDMKTGKVDFL